MKRSLVIAGLLLSLAHSQIKTNEISRPKILGVAHIGLRTDNIDAARKFYTGVLGLAEPFSLDKLPEEGSGLLLTYFKVNDKQYIELFPELTDPKQDRLSHISFETVDAEQMRRYLASKGVKVPDKLEPMQDGNRGFDVNDPTDTMSSSSNIGLDRFTRKTSAGHFPLRASRSASFMSASLSKIALLPIAFTKTFWDFKKPGTAA